MSTRPGFLMVCMEPPAAIQEVFNAWYDTEHVPERVVLAGFRTAYRYVCLDGYPRYMALYDLDSVGVLETPEYLAMVGDHFTPWTKWTTRHMPGYKIVAEQVTASGEVTQLSPRLLAVKIRATPGITEEKLLTALDAVFKPHPEASQIRLFSATQPQKEFHALITFAAPPAAPINYNELLKTGASLGMVNMYAPYNPVL